jgi:GT2 family glycosyltransferase
LTAVAPPRLSVIIPTFNNAPVLRRCLASWERLAADQPVEIIVIEDGCTDDTAATLSGAAGTLWGRRALRVVHEDNVHQLRCNNRGFREAHADLMMVWDDDMFLEARWFVPELLATFAAYPEIGLLSLIRGLNLYPLDQPITRWSDLHDPRRMTSTLGPGRLLSWLRLAEVDIVVRPWVVRRRCLETVGPLDEAFAPVEWDEADLCCRIRQAGWKVATHGYERLGAFSHLGSSTLGRMPSERHQAMVLPNGQLFHDRWGELIGREHSRRRVTWWRRVPAAGLPLLAARMAGFALLKAGIGTRWSRFGPSPESS